MGTVRAPACRSCFGDTTGLGAVIGGGFKRQGVGKRFLPLFIEDLGEFIEICYFVVLSPFVIWYGWT